MSRLSPVRLPWPLVGWQCRRYGVRYAWLWLQMSLALRLVVWVARWHARACEQVMDVLRLRDRA